MVFLLVFMMIAGWGGVCVCGEKKWPGFTFSKMVASTGFLLLAVHAGILGGGNYSHLLGIGLILCWMGDLFLGFRTMRFFIPGLVSFLIAHLLFGAAFITLGVSTKWMLCAAGINAIADVFILRWLWPKLPADMRIPIVAYMLVITSMVVLAAGAVGHGATGWLLTAAIIFTVSDLFVAREKFIRSDLINNLVGLALYYIATALLALSPALLAR